MKFITEFEKIMKTEGFKSIFPNHRLCTEDDIRIFQDELAEDGQILFSVESNGKFNEYYFYEKSTSGIEIGVFSVHTIVQIWETPEAFLAWLVALINKRQTQP